MALSYARARSFFRGGVLLSKPMKTVAVAALAAALSFHASAEEKPLDKANAKLSAGQKSVKSGAKKLESETNKSLESGRKSGRKVGKNLEKGANDTAKSLRQKLGTEK
jgi:hypothetical protein